MLSRKLLFTHIPVYFSVACNYNPRENLNFKRPFNKYDRKETYGFNKNYQSHENFSRENYSKENFRKNLTGKVSPESFGYLSESQWLEKIDRELSVNKYEDFILKEQPFKIECHNMEYKTWNKFSEIEDLDKRLSEVLIKSGLDQMTQIQKTTFDIQNRQLLDLLGSAETGSGKTIAYLSPLLNSILKTYPQEMMESLYKNGSATQYPLILILAPTRELVLQISMETNKLLKLTPLKSVNVIGGANSMIQIGNIFRGCHALVATPGRLKDFIQRGVVSLKYCNKLVIDEADRMLDMGFEPQIREIMFGFDLPSVNERYTSMFSATFPNSVMSLAKNLLKTKYGTVVIGKNAGSSESCVPESIEQKFLLTTNGSLFKDCFQFIKENNVKIIVFCNTKIEVDTFCRFATNQNINVSSLHGDYSQSRRQLELKLFKENKTKILVATSVAARGLDITDVECVINIGLPVTIDDYLHRVGRCGRMGRPGKAVTFVQKSGNSISILKDFVHMFNRNGVDIPEFFNSQISDFKIERSKSVNYDEDKRFNKVVNRKQFTGKSYNNDRYMR